MILATAVPFINIRLNIMIRNWQDDGLFLLNMPKKSQWFDSRLQYSFNTKQNTHIIPLISRMIKIQPKSQGIMN